MLFQTKDQIAMGESELKDCTFHKFSDLTNIEGTGIYEDMPKGKRYRVHTLVAKVLIEKGYAKAAV